MEPVTALAGLAGPLGSLFGGGSTQKVNTSQSLSFSPVVSVNASTGQSPINSQPSASGSATSAASQIPDASAYPNWWPSGTTETGLLNEAPAPTNLGGDMMPWLIVAAVGVGALLLFKKKGS